MNDFAAQNQLVLDCIQPSSTRAIGTVWKVSRPLTIGKRAC